MQPVAEIASAQSLDSFANKEAPILNFHRSFCALV